MINLGLKRKRRLAALLFAGTLVACAGTPDEAGSAKAGAEAQVSATLPTAETFTTEGKPTKTIETPRGPREIYDISQDPNIQHLLKGIYNRGNATFGDMYLRWALNRNVPANPNFDVEYIRLARKVSTYDLYRLGCKRIAATPNQPLEAFNFGELPLTLNLGNPELSHQEMQNRKVTRFGDGVIPSRDGVITEEIRLKGRWEFENYAYVPPLEGVSEIVDWKSGVSGRNEGGRSETITYGTYPVSGNPSVGYIEGKIYNANPHFYIGELSQISLADTIQLLSQFECSEWFRD